MLGGVIYLILEWAAFLVYGLRITRKGKELQRIRFHKTKKAGYQPA